jgi:hypothetical protein
MRPGLEKLLRARCAGSVVAARVLERREPERAAACRVAVLARATRYLFRTLDFGGRGSPLISFESAAGGTRTSCRTHYSCSPSASVTPFTKFAWTACECRWPVRVSSDFAWSSGGGRGVDSALCVWHIEKPNYLSQRSPAHRALLLPLARTNRSVLPHPRRLKDRLRTVHCSFPSCSQEGNRSVLPHPRRSHPTEVGVFFVGCDVRAVP